MPVVENSKIIIVFTFRLSSFYNDYIVNSNISLSDEFLYKIE